jgi:lipopolysaccharide/colanic/teichoic acid biosynthesis glycosyltransferase
MRDSARSSPPGLKVGFDIVIATMALVLVAPLMALVALCVFLESPGPILYRARRVGYLGAEVDVLKFRKMRKGASGCPLTVANDARFTKVGRWLAAAKLDELPQLINVLKGEMSLIGPRPEDPDFVRQHAEQFELILRVRPGITGLSQLAFFREGGILDPDDPIGHYEKSILPQKLQLDRLYVSHWRPLMDVQILWWTFIAALFRVPVAVDRATGHMNVCRSRNKTRPELIHAPRATSLSNPEGQGALVVGWQNQSSAGAGDGLLG